MPLLESTLIATAVPIVLDFVKGVGAAASRKWLGLSVDDAIKLNASRVENLKALAELDKPYGAPSQWVVDVRGSFRYVAAAILVFGGSLLGLYGALEGVTDLVATGVELASLPFGFIFGERLVLSFKQAAKGER